MNFSKIVVFLIFAIISSTIIGLYYDSQFLFSIGHIFLMPLVGIWYGIRRKWQYNDVDRLVYFAYLMGSLSDSLILIDWDTRGEFYQIAATFIMHFVFIIIFRKEGTIIYSEKFTELPKIILPLITIFIFFGQVLMLIIPDLIYFILILYAVEEAILLMHGYFRKVGKLSFFLVAGGVTLVFVKDVIYSYHFFVYQNSKLFLYAIMYVLNLTAYFMIAYGVLVNQNADKKTYDKISKKAVIQSIKDIFKKRDKDIINRIIETIFLPHTKL